MAGGAHVSKQGRGPIRIVVMGVSGSGKTTVASALAEKLCVPFIEGDQLHPQSNIDKMSAGRPLDDADRWPWLDAVADALSDASGGAIVTCSALKKAYRDRLRNRAGKALAFVYLDADPKLLRARMTSRRHHFMPASLLDSQLATLEVPSGEPDVLWQGADAPPREIVAAIVAWLDRKLSPNSPSRRPRPSTE